jgi:hypothetical protein
MRTSPRVLAGVATLGFLIALVVIQQQSSDAPATRPAGDARLPGDGARTREEVLATVPSPGLRTAPTTGAGDKEVAGQCLQISNEAIRFATMERDAAQPVDAPDPGDEPVIAELSSLQRSLAGTGDPDHLVTALLLDLGDAQTSNDRSVHTTLQELGTRAASSDSPLLAWHALRVCFQAREGCPYTHLEQRLLDSQRQNADAWVLVAMLRHRRGDPTGALAAMQGAARASTSTWYWTETIAVIERSLAAETAIPYPDRLYTAVGAAASALPVSPHQMCKAESAASRAWAEACLAYGILSAGHNETDLARSISYVIREQALSALGDMERAAKVAAERAESAELRRLSRLRWQLHEALLATDPARLRSYLGAVQQHGELAGVRVFLQKELPLLMERAGLLEHDGARECVAQLLEQPTTAGIRPEASGP